MCQGLGRSGAQPIVQSDTRGASAHECPRGCGPPAVLHTALVRRPTTRPQDLLGLLLALGVHFRLHLLELTAQHRIHGTEVLQSLRTKRARCSEGQTKARLKRGGVGLEGWVGPAPRRGGGGGRSTFMRQHHHLRAEGHLPHSPLRGDALEAGEVPPPSRAPSLCPATVSLTASASLNGICNR